VVAERARTPGDHPARAREQEGAVDVQECPPAAPALVQLTRLLRGSPPPEATGALAAVDAVPALACEAAALALSASLPAESALLAQVLQAAGGGGLAGGPQMHALDSLNISAR
jgi:hypothetical protein